MPRGPSFSEPSATTCRSSSSSSSSTRRRTSSCARPRAPAATRPRPTANTGRLRQSSGSTPRWPGSSPTACPHDEAPPRPRPARPPRSPPASRSRAPRRLRRAGSSSRRAGRGAGTRSSTAVSLPTSRMRSPHSPARCCSSAAPSGVVESPIIRARSEEAGGSATRQEIGSLADVPRPTSTRATTSRGRSFLVCAHGRRDACCARLGLPLFDALNAQLLPTHLWQSSHLGGHRFAPNVVVLPVGIQLGRIPLERAAEVVGLAGGAAGSRSTSTAGARSTRPRCRRPRSPSARSQVPTGSATSGSSPTRTTGSPSRRPRASSPCASSSVPGPRPRELRSRAGADGRVGAALESAAAASTRRGSS